jgi:hypothetical protein
MAKGSDGFMDVKISWSTCWADQGREDVFRCFIAPSLGGRERMALPAPVSAC